MPNLIAKPQPQGSAAARAAESDVIAAINEDSVNFGEVLKILRRRRKFLFVTAGAVFALSLINTVYQRINNPVFAGSFSLLISDPLSDERGRTSEGGARFEELARNTTSNDIPTMIEEFRSPLLLQPTAQKYGISASSLASRIRITSGSGKGILK